MAYDYGACLTDQSGLSEFVGRDSVDLLARLIFSEAQGESWAGKQGVAFVAQNRKLKNIPEFGTGGTFESVILHTTQGQADFVGMTTSYARCPDRSLQAWSDSLYIAENMATQYNPIGQCLWFRTQQAYDAIKGLTQINGHDTVSLDGGANYREVVEKVVIGNHVFFRVQGY